MGEFIEKTDNIQQNDEININKQDLVYLLKNYKQKLREKLEKETNIDDVKVFDEDDIRLKDDNVILTKGQIKKLLENHEEYLKNAYEDEINLENKELLKYNKDDKKKKKKKIKTKE